MGFMNLRMIEYFVEAAECGSFTQAANNLYTAQPNFSKQIAALERAVDTQLFFREHRSVRLTPAGLRFYEAVKDIPAQLARGIDAAREASDLEERTLRIGILEGNTLSPAMMAGFKSFQDTHPDCIQTIVREDFDGLCTGLEEHRFDVVFTILFSLQNCQGIRTMVLSSQQTFAAVNVLDPLSRKETLSISDLSGETFMILEERRSPISFQNITNLLGALQIPAAQTRKAESTEALFTAVEANLGVAIVDGQNRPRHSPYVRLIPILDASPAPDFGAAWSASAPKKIVHGFVEEMERVAEKQLINEQD